MVRYARRARARASTILDRSSVISATSAASMAACVPRAPMAMPTCTRASAGASLTPSPTMATECPACCKATMAFTLSTRLDLIEAELRADAPGDPLVVAGEHDDLFHAGRFQAGHGLPGAG